jgi:carbamoyl-phosphate synthase small subunit
VPRVVSKLLQLAAEAGLVGGEESRLADRVDTRRLTRHLRERGAMRGVIAEGAEPTPELSRQLMASPSMEGLDLASRATVEATHVEGEGPLVVAFDYGMKRNIVRMLVDQGIKVAVVPSETTAEQVRAMKPKGVFLSIVRRSTAVTYALDTIRELAQDGIPTFDLPRAPVDRARVRGE